MSFIKNIIKLVVGVFAIIILASVLAFVFISGPPDESTSSVALQLEDDDTYSFTTESYVILSNDYKFVVKQIDSEDEKVWVEIDKNDEFIEDEVISEDNFEFYKTKYDDLRFRDLADDADDFYKDNDILFEFYIVEYTDSGQVIIKIDSSFENKNVVDKTNSISTDYTGITEVNSDDSSNVTINSHRENNELHINYDKLQLLYTNINETMDYNEVMTVVQDSNLPFRVKEYSDGPTIKIAFDDEVTPLLYAKKSGDYVKIHFNEDNDKNGYHFAFMEYLNLTTRITIFQYETGTYWSFRNNENYRGQNYKGYYIKDPASEYEFKIAYDNGLKSTESWIPVQTKQIQFEYIYTLLN